MTRIYDHLSESTDGQPILVAGTDLAGATTLHTATSESSEHDLIDIEVQNVDAANDHTFYLMFGHATAGKVVPFNIPKNKGSVIAVASAFLDNGGVVKGYGDEANKLVVLGGRERIA